MENRDSLTNNPFHSGCALNVGEKAITKTRTTAVFLAISEVIWRCWQINKWPLRSNWLCFKWPSYLKISWLLKSLCPLFHQERVWHRQKLPTRLKWRLLFSHITAAIYEMIILKLSLNPQCSLNEGYVSFLLPVLLCIL